MFNSVDPFNGPFTERITCRAILAPVDYYFSDDEFTSLSDAARAVGDTWMYVVLTEERDQPQYMVRDYQDINSSSLVTGSERAIFGPSGSWGMIISHLDHAVVGGSRPFFKRLRATFPPSGPLRPEDEPGEPIPFDMQVYEFFRELTSSGKREAILEWLPELLVHIYGEERGRELLAESGLVNDEGRRNLPS